VKIEIEREKDGRWIAEVPDLPGVMVYGKTRAQALAKVEALALRVIAEKPDLREDLLDMALLAKRRREPSRPLRLNRRWRKHHP
jgi:predicted RNase H-like HicB family nuclease